MRVTRENQASVAEAALEDVGHLAKIYAPRVEIAPDLREAVQDASRGSMRYIITNLAAIAEFAAVRGLNRVSKADWTGAFHTGEPPALRRNLDVLPTRRGRTAA